MRKLAIVTAVILVLVAGSAFLLANRLDGYLNENRDWISAQAEAAVGRKVEFGKLGVSFSGGVGASVADLRLGEDPAYGEGDFLALDEVVVRVKIWPALFGRYEVSSVMLRRPRITLIQGTTGMNIDSLGGPAEEPDSAEVEPAAAFAIALLDVEQGELRYVDRSGAEEVVLTIEQLNVDASDITTDRPIEFTLSAALLGAERANLAATGSVGPMIESEPVPVTLTLDAKALSLDALLALPQLAGSLPEGARASGTLDLGAELQGNPEKLAWQAQIDGRDAAIDLPDTLNKSAGVPLSYQVEGQYLGDRVEIESGVLTFDRAQFQTRGAITLGEDTAYDITVTSEGLPLAGWERMLPSVEGLGLEGRAGLDLAVKGNTASEALPAITGSVALADVVARLPEQPAVEDLEAQLQLRDGGMVLSGANFRLGGSPATLAANIPDLANPRIAFTLTSPAMRGESVGLNEPGDEKPDVLRNLRIVGNAVPETEGTLLDATISSGGGTVAGVEYERLTGRVRADAKQATLEELALQAFGGSAKIRGTYDLAATERPGWTLGLQLADMRAAQLAASQLGFASDLFEGKVDSSFTLAGRGFDREALAEALTGKGNIDIVEGMLKNVNLGEVVLQKITGVSGLSNMLDPAVRSKHPQLFAEGNTAFRTLRSSLEVRNGRVHADKLNLEALDFGLTGKGSVGLDGDVKLDTTLRFSQDFARNLAKSKGVARYLAGSDGRIAIPVTIGGSLAGIQVKPDLGFLEQALARAATDQLRDKATDLLTNALKGKTPKPAAKPKDPALVESAEPPAEKAAEPTELP